MKLNLRSIDLNLLPVFVAVVEEGQLSRAAARLGMSQPAVSAALQRLRLSVGDPLFVRSRNGLSPTPRARALHEEIRPLLQTLAETLQPGQGFDPAHSERLFRLLAVDYFETIMLGLLIRRIRQHSQGIGIAVLPPQDGWRRQLLAAEADFSLDTQLPEDERLLSEAVSKEDLVVVARRDHPVIHGTLTLEHFLQAEHVVLPPREHSVLPLDQILGRPGWRRRIGAHVGQYGNLLSVASQTDLIATVPRRLAAAQAAPLKLQVLDFPVAVPTVPIYLIWPKALDKDPAHRWLRELIRESLAKLA